VGHPRFYRSAEALRHPKASVLEHFHKLILPDVQKTLLPILGWGYWNRAVFGQLGDGGETKVPHFVRDDTNSGWIGEDIGDSV
jgi:hypothetical protein